MNLSQIIDVLPLQVYLRRGELVIRFSTPADLTGRLAETSAAIADLDRQSEPGRPERASRRAATRPVSNGGLSEGDTDPQPANGGSESEQR